MAPCLGLPFTGSNFLGLTPIFSTTLASFQALHPSVHLSIHPSIHPPTHLLSAGFTFLFSIYYGWGAHVCHIRGQLVGVGFPSAIWVPELKLRSSDLMTDTCTFTIHL